MLSISWADFVFFKTLKESYIVDYHRSQKQMGEAAFSYPLESASSQSNYYLDLANYLPSAIFQLAQVTNLHMSTP